MVRLEEAREETLARKLERASKMLAEGVGVGEVARRLELSPWALRRRFKERFGTTPQQYRPRSEKPTVSFKLTSAAELHQLEEAAEKADTNVSTFVRRLVRRHLRLTTRSEK
ncbi:hypothetical protein [Nannocystis sp. SCPEA4]|uniref:helix-turn-helix domain-containing protein n=1 Tax=Nannocystis sp. SCPEA4 TaxID=2996787 RepID=UPI00226DF65B|nr:hypothetical protein [Nannocystis sp. SCPEA4]MCY1062155.1 hypothetical protein [Nannocystis sp. SCPEA4]